MNGSDPPSPSETPDPDESETTLRAKYLDYCSAQLADLLLYLTPDEIFLVAHRATEGDGEERSEISYLSMMEVATEWLASRIPLPPFEIWVEDYRAHPELYETYLMGLWESETAN